MSRDAHTRPPEPMRTLFKRWQKSSAQEIDQSDEIVDFARAEHNANLQIRRMTMTNASVDQLRRAFRTFMSTSTSDPSLIFPNDTAVYTIEALPGLYVYPSLLPVDVQILLLNRLVHRDLSNSSHNSNLHLHYNINYLKDCGNSHSEDFHRSFFGADRDTILEPKDPRVHKPLTIKQMLDRKLRWITLGGQYDWTAKTYPSGAPPDFPEDIALLLKGMFSEVDPQAAIVNFYTPGDTLSVHQDVSEECDRGLISVSIGCDGLFVIGDNQGSYSTTMRLRSGDVVLMSGQSRFAWHAVPKILCDTCPDSIRNWPAVHSDSPFKVWKGWLANKRINLNVRQMRYSEGQV